MDGVDDPDVIDPSQVHGGDPEVGVLHHQERYAPVSELDGVGVPQLMGCEPAADHQILCEWLREPNLKQRATAATGAAVGPEDRGEELPGARYAIAGLVWTALDAGFIIITLSVHYHDILVKIVPKGVVVGGFILFFVVLLLPIPIALGAPLLQRARYGTREVNRVVK